MNLKKPSNLEPIIIFLVILFVVIGVIVLVSHGVDSLSTEVKSNGGVAKSIGIFINNVKSEIK